MWHQARVSSRPMCLGTVQCEKKTSGFPLFVWVVPSCTWSNTNQNQNNNIDVVKPIVTRFLFRFNSKPIRRYAFFDRWCIIIITISVILLQKINVGTMFYNAHAHIRSILSHYHLGLHITYPCSDIFDTLLMRIFYILIIFFQG